MTEPLGGVKEMLGTAMGFAIIKRSSAPFELLKTCGSTKSPERAAVVGPTSATTMENMNTTFV